MSRLFKRKPKIRTENPAKKRLFIWRAVAILLPVLVIGGSVGGVAIMGALKPEPEKKEDTIKAVPVLTALAAQDDVTLSVTTQGEVQPRIEINVVPQVSGHITYMSPQFIDGGAFKKGDILVRIEATDYELRLVQARANVAQAETVLTREKSEAALALSDWQDLGTGNTASPLTLREPQMAEAAARLASAKAQYDEAKLQLDRTVIRAPFTGRVTTRMVDPGEFVNAGTRLGQIYSAEIMDVRLPLTQDNLRQAGLSLGYTVNQSNKPIPVKLSANVAGTQAHWMGQIVRTDSRFDTQTRFLFAYAELKDPFGKGAYDGIAMAPGLFVSAELEGQRLDDVITIPRTALRGENQVYVANDDNTLSIKTVQVLSSNREQAIIGAGLDIGSRVITSPIRGVSSGMQIEVVKSINRGTESNDTEVASTEMTP